MPNNHSYNQSPVGDQNQPRQPASNHAVESMHSPHGNRSARGQRNRGHQTQGMSAQQLQQLQHLRARLAEADQRNALLEQEIGDYHETLQSYRITIEDKSGECMELKDKVADLEKRMSSANHTSGWSIARILPGSSRDGRSSGDDQEVARLRAKLAKCKEALASREDRIGQLEQQHTAAQNQQTAAFAQELDEFKSRFLVKTPVVSDSEIQGEWKALGCVINQFVLRYLKGPLDPLRIAQLAQQEMFRWLPEVATALPVPLIRSVMVEAWVWHFLCCRIFDTESEIWAGEIGKSFSQLCDQLRSCEPHASTQDTTTIEKFHDWRVRSAHLVSRIESHDRTSAIARTAEDMLSALRNFAPSTLSHAEIEDMNQDALNIVNKAATLDRVFRQSRANFHVFITRLKLPLAHPPSFGFGFDSETMERTTSLPTLGEDDDPTAIVDLAVSPGILKAGNADGENYNAERVLVKLQALCNLKELLDVFGAVKEEGKDEVMHDGPGIKAEPGPETRFIKQEPDEEGDEVDLVTLAQCIR